MKKTLFALAAIGFAFAATNAQAQTTTTTTTTTVSVPPERRAEFGGGIGWPTSVSGKYWFDDRIAVQGQIGYQFFAPSWWGGTADVLFHSKPIIEPSSVGARIPLYIGLGARLIDYSTGSNRTRGGPRIPIGVEAQLLEAPVSVFAEMAPGLQFAGGNTDVSFDATLGGRVLF